MSDFAGRDAAHLGARAWDRYPDSRLCPPRPGRRRGFNLMEWKHGTRPTDRLSRPRRQSRYERNFPEHPGAPAPQSRSFAPFAAAASPCRARFRDGCKPAHLSRTTRAQAARSEPFALLPVPSQPAASTVRRPALSPAPWQDHARTRRIAATALDGGRFEPRPFRHRRRRNPANFPNHRVLSADSVRSSPSPKPRLGVKRKAAASGPTSQAESSEPAPGLRATDERVNLAERQRERGAGQPLMRCVHKSDQRQVEPVGHGYDGGIPIAHAEPDGVERGKEGKRQHRANGSASDQHISHGSPEH